MSYLSQSNSKPFPDSKTEIRHITLPRLLPLTDRTIRLIMICLVIFDGLLAAGLFVLACKIRSIDENLFYMAQKQFGPLSLSLPTAFQPQFYPYQGFLYIIPFIMTASFGYRGLYRVRGEFSFSEDLINIFKAVSISSLLVTMIAFFYRGGHEDSSFSYSRLVFVLNYSLGLVVFTTYRVALRSLQTFYRRRHINVIPILIVGSNEIAEMCINVISDDPKLGRRVVGLVTPDGVTANKGRLGEFPVLGKYDEMHRFIRLYGIREILITDPSIQPELLFNTMVKCGRGHRVAFRVVPNLLNCIPRKTYIEQLGSVPVVRLFEEPLSSFGRLIKRSIDLIVSSLVLFISAPLWVIIAIAIKLESRGPVFYRQERVGMDGHIFLLFKFRSMSNDSEADEEHRRYMERMIRKHGDTNLGTVENPSYKFINCRRLTRVGRILRRLSLDELPQVFNVFKGEMSLVGPRPPIHYEVECYEPWHRKRLDVKPGLTGLWQVSGRYRLSFDQMVKLDIYYIENWSAWLDLKIILKTMPALFMREDSQISDAG